MSFSLARLTNTVLLLTVLVLTFTGLYGLFWTMNGWVWDAHRFSGWLLVAAVPWKTWVVARALRGRLRSRRGFNAPVWAALLLTLLTLVVLALGLLWNWRLGPDDYPLRQTAIAWHWMLALGLLLPFLLHVWARWLKPRRVDTLSRRAFLRWGGLSAAALLTWQVAEFVSRARRPPGSSVRATGSRLAALFSGNAYPVTHNLAPRPEQVQLENWRLEVRGAVAAPRSFTYAELLALADASLDATLDCTLGWYAVQAWSGVRLSSLLQEAGVSRLYLAVRLVSVTGYAKILPFDEARGILLAARVGGETLAFEHGYPLRAVVPTRRGWFWVKWLERIEVIDL